MDKIADFSDFKPSNDIESEEFPYFVNVEDISIKEIKQLRNKLEQLNRELNEQTAIVEEQTGDDKKDAIKIYNQILKKIEQQVDRINLDLERVNEPYFGKIQISRHHTSKLPAGEMTAYIGKFAYFDKNSQKVLVTDWRAPIANVYYMNSGPTKGVEFKSPIGILSGDLNQKRQFDISIGRIHHIYDAKSGNVSADEFLLSQLNKKMGKKLSEIVATIQNQQNEIIRANINQPIIMQGVAGSGKTTIVLHRLAYLFYTFPKEIQPERSLIIVPNQLFLDYISDVLPSLGIRNVQANTYIFWAKRILGWGDKFNLSSLPNDLSVKLTKGSEQFIENLKKFFAEYESQLLKNLPFSESDAVAKRYNELKANHSEIYLKERLDLALEGTYLSQQVNRKLKNTSLQVSDATKQRIAQFLKEATDIREIYFKFINDARFNSAKVQKYTQKTFRRFEFKQEDLAPLVWLHFQLNGTGDSLNDYTVVDEAQDMNPFEIYTLFLASRKGNLLLAGDLAQAINPPFAIASWNDVQKIFSEKGLYFQLNRSYRSTIEIISYANAILKGYFPTDYTLPEAVLRHGEEVEEVLGFKGLTQLINSEFEKGVASVALICKDEAHCMETRTKLELNHIKLKKPIFDFSQSNYQTGIHLIPVNKAKGLEFDTVILVDKNRYNLEEALDARLFYVASTRALHRLYILKNDNQG
ncbi:ATP-binding domain-containing protein [bacterium]|nr:ATP-binding domain-containing protein [bacterium]